MTENKSLQWNLVDKHELERISNQSLETLEAEELLPYANIRYEDEGLEIHLIDPEFASALASLIQEKAKDGEWKGSVKYKIQHIIQA